MKWPQGLTFLLGELWPRTLDIGGWGEHTLASLEFPGYERTGRSANLRPLSQHNNQFVRQWVSCNLCHGIPVPSASPTTDDGTENLILKPSVGLHKQSHFVLRLCGCGVVGGVWMPGCHAKIKVEN